MMCSALAASLTVARAGELKVDINRDAKNGPQYTATGYTQWNTNSSGGTSSTGTALITQSFPIAVAGEMGVHARALPFSQFVFTLTNNAPQILLAGESGFYVLLQYSDNLLNWIAWTNATLASGILTFKSPGFPNPVARFYRAVPVQ